MALCDKGALNILSSESNDFAKAAFNQLLEWNLAAKYAFKGRLDISNIVNQTIYDAGTIAVGKPFESLDSLSNADVGVNRETLVVNLDSDSGDLVDFIKTCESSVKDATST